MDFHGDMAESVQGNESNIDSESGPTVKTWRGRFRRIMRTLVRSVIALLAIYGMVCLVVPYAVSLGWTNDKGVVDRNSGYFQSMYDKYDLEFRVDSGDVQKGQYDVLRRILLLDAYYPTNAKLILDAYLQCKDESVATRMLDAVDFYLKDSTHYVDALNRLRAEQPETSRATSSTVYDWMNIEEWKYFREALARDRRAVDSASKLTGVPSRVIMSCIVGEQVRKFNARRERLKDVLTPLRHMSMSTQFSYGIAGIKDNTAERIEKNLLDSTSVFYLGKEYEHLLDYDSEAEYGNRINDTLNERLQRLTVIGDHFYAYLYTALFIRQIEQQWARVGYPVDDRPEIIATIFNLGFARSKPKFQPEVGGAVVKIREKEYSFGSIAYDFYYSGELSTEFPLVSVKSEKLRAMTRDTLGSTNATVSMIRNRLVHDRTLQ